MNRPSIDTIRSEHLSMSAIAHGLLHFSRAIRERQPLPDFRVFRAMLYYLDVFVERFHHPKEDRYLFAKISLRTNESAEVLAQLHNDHARGEQNIRELMQSVIRLEFGHETYADEFVTRVDSYVAFHSRHMLLEEDIVLPLAQRALTQADWQEIDAAFLGNVDPLLGVDEKKGFDALFTKIVTITPPPIGVGPEIGAGG